MPAGEAPAGSAVGEPESSVRLPPWTAKAPTASAELSSTNSQRPSGLRRASTAPTPPVPLTGVLPSSASVPSRPIAYRESVPEAVFTVNRYRPSGLISTQHGAVCRSPKGDDPIDVSVPRGPSLNAETVPVPAPTLWAFDTNS
jgi:hypothetical protein